MSLQEVGLEASKAQPCPLCGHDHYCYLVANESSAIFKAVCQWTTEPPDGWDRTGTAKDGRGIFTQRGYRRKRRHYPDFVQLAPQPLADIPEWKDHLLDMSGDRLPLRRDGRALELAIEYLYPTDDSKPLGKVVRIQWSDRRRCYEQNRKTKQVRPWHWVGSLGDGFWSDRGKGDKPWPLYRETEAKEEILRGGLVFAVAGEQAVETYRQLGLVATTCQGGEANYQQIAAKLQDAFTLAQTEKLRPVLVIHPDNDITGDNKFGEQLLKECDFAKIPAVVLNPIALWPQMPPGGDIKDWVDGAGQTSDAILRSLEAEIDNAIDRQEEEAKARIQRSRWRAPEAWQGELGYWVVDKETQERRFVPKTDFDFQVERELASDDGGGLLLQVKRTDDRAQRRIFIKSTDYSTSQKFKDALKRGLGVGVICNLTNFEVEALIRVRLHEYRVTRKGKAFRLIDRVGQQESGDWVFQDQQYTSEGTTTSEEESLWVWNAKLTGEESTVPMPQVAPQNAEAIKQLVDVMRRAFGSNFYPALLSLGYAAAGVHYQTILKQEGAFPTLNLFGDPGSGKTSAAECALSLVGMHQDGMMCDISLSAAYERLKLSGSLLHCLDDPTRTPELNAFLKGFYNGKARVVRGKEVSFNVQRPHSPMMVTSNHACGENDAATQSRLVRLFFARSTDGDRDAFYQLPLVQAQASGGITQLMKLGYPAEEVHALERELLPHLPHAHIRIAKSLALILYYAQAVASLAQAPEDLKGYVIQTICAVANDPDESGDSLRDFFEKVFELQSRSKLGDWNFRWIDKEEGSKVLAVYMPGVWAALDAEFKPGYNRKVIESLLTQQGISRTRQRFHRSEDESRAYYRMLLSPRHDSAGEEIIANPPETVTRFCYEIPVDLLRECSEKIRSTRSTEPSDEPQTPVVEPKPLLIESDQRGSTEPQNSINEAPISINEAVADLDRLCDSLRPAVPAVENPVDQPEASLIVVDRNRSTSETGFAQAVEPDSTPLVDLVDRKNASPIDAVDQPASPPQVGDTVLVKAIAVWRRSGSDKLPWEQVPKEYRSKADIPISLLSTSLFDELLAGGKVIEVRGDRVRLRHQKTARTSVFAISDVVVLPKGDAP